MNIEAGQLVVYDPGYKIELGRVKRLNDRKPGTAFVWYHGDTATCTNVAKLYPISLETAYEMRDIFENAYAFDEIINKGKNPEREEYYDIK